MPITRITIDDFLNLASVHPVLDVRSPGEYIHAHIPGAHSFPLFSDEERKVVGTLYKQEGQQKAIKAGLSYFGKKMVEMVESAEKIIGETSTEKTVLVHCWRGGMRSAGIAWLLDLYGFRVYTLTGGYKSYRNWVLKQFEKEYIIHLLGGYSGSAKTVLLNRLRDAGEAIIDLEGLALHKGSSFGNLDMVLQPSQEMFENKLATQLSLYQNEPHRHIWVEDESQRMGLINIPRLFLRSMHNYQLFFLDIPFEERLNFIVSEYGTWSMETLANAIVRIKKRLGPLETKNALQYLEEKELKECFRILLKYYDKAYMKSLNKWLESKQPIFRVEHNQVDPEYFTHTLLQKQQA